MSSPKRAVVLGASGIGKHHVKWLMRAGCDVVGFLGTSPESVEKTKASLEETLGFTGAGYTSVSRLIGECRPQLASICSPMDVHYEHAAACIGAGAHVLCEKPLVGGDQLSTERQLFLAERIVSAADSAKVLLGVNTQYAAAAPHLLAISGVDSVDEYFMQMESRGAGGTRQHEAIWHDLAAHPISVLLALVPDGNVDWGSVQCVVESQRNECAFDFARPDGSAVKARILLRNAPEGPMCRQFAVNGIPIGYEGRNDDDGVYCTYLTHGGAETKAKDFMEESITRFATGDLLATGDTGLKNLEMQLRLLENAGRH